MNFFKTNTYIDLFFLVHGHFLIDFFENLGPP